MNVYESLGLKTVINASDTYTRIGGSRMCKEVRQAMYEAGEHFVDIVALNRAICEKIAAATQNEGAFISSGAAGCVVLTAGYLISGKKPKLVKMLPDASACEKNEILVFDVQTKIGMLPYWHLIELSGARLVRVEPTLAALKAAVTPKTAGMFFFAANLYEPGLPPLGEVIATMKACGVRVIVDAAAQLPPKSNLWYYTKTLGAAGVIFSGGKFLMGPQSTGLFLGDRDIAEGCYPLCCPNVSVGRPYKVGKEEFVAIYTAVMRFVECDEAAVFKEQERRLDVITNILKDRSELAISRTQCGRLEQTEPMLIIDLPSGKTGKDCADYLYNQCNPAIDIGYYLADDPTGGPHQIFINSINLNLQEADFVARSLCDYLDHR